MAEGRVGFPKRLYPKCLGVLLLCAGVVGSISYFVGATGGRVFAHLGLAALCIVVSTLAWEVVERRALGETATPGLAAWLAFPASVCLGLASLPFLVLVVYPEAEKYFTKAGRVTASISQSASGPTLDLDFPEPMMQRGENLRINSRTLPEGYVRSHPRIFVWRAPSTLSVQIDPLVRDLGLEKIETIGVNLLAEVPRFTYRSGKIVPRQMVSVK